MIYIILIFSSLIFLNFLKIRTNAYLFKHFNFTSLMMVFSVISIVISACVVEHPNTLK